MMKLEVIVDFEAPETETEKVLAKIWASLLVADVSKIGRQTSFFELGGDSISAIQLVSRCKMAGLSLSTVQIMKSQTLRRLAAASKKMDVKNSVLEGPIVGPVRLSPVQDWFFKSEAANPHHYNQSMYLVPRSRLEVGAVSSALVSLANHHDMLRAEYKRTEEGFWKQSIRSTSDAIVPHVESISVKTDDELDQHILSLQQSLSLTGGRLMAGLLINFNSTQKLFLTIHHLVVDLVSWRIIFEDLETLLCGGKLVAKTTSFKRWTEETFSHFDFETLQTDWTAHIRPIQNMIQAR